MKIAVLFGGTSAERKVSIASGIKIAEALLRRSHQVIAIDTAGGFVQIDLKGNYAVGAIPPDEKSLSSLDDRYLTTRLNERDLADLDVVFIGLHGGHGEDGTIQALLNLSNVTYTGSDVLASAAAMDKAFSKMVFKLNGIPTPEWLLYRSTALNDTNAAKREIISTVGFPLVIKPNAQGSTVGLSIVNSENEIAPALKLAFEYDSRILAEKYIAGRELTVAIVGDYDLPVIEIVPEGGFYSYECKYTSGKSKYICPAVLPTDLAEKCKQLGRKAFDVLGCRDYGRVDFRLRGGEELYCLEVNTLPGMTPTSLVPKAMKAIGIEFDELIEIIANLAVRRKSEK